VPSSLHAPLGRHRHRRRWASIRTAADPGSNRGRRCPPQRAGATLLAARNRAINLIAEDGLTEKRAAAPRILPRISIPDSAQHKSALVHERGIEPRIPVFDKSQHTDGTFSRDDFTYDHERNCYICPAGKELRQRQKIYRIPRPLVDEDGMMRYRASKLDYQSCSLKPQCCPNAPARKIPRSIHEGARYGPRHRQNRGVCHLTATTNEPLPIDPLENEICRKPTFRPGEPKRPINSGKTDARLTELGRVNDVPHRRAALL
jgi:hypothetical protein